MYAHALDIGVLVPPATSLIEREMTFYRRRLLAKRHKDVMKKKKASKASGKNSLP